MDNQLLNRKEWVTIYVTILRRSVADIPKPKDDVDRLALLDLYEEFNKDIQSKASNAYYSVSRAISKHTNEKGMRTSVTFDFDGAYVFFLMHVSLSEKIEILKELESIDPEDAIIHVFDSELKHTFKKQ